MITQEINKYKSEYVYQSHPQTPIAQYFGKPQMGKLEYALYLKTLPFKKGDLITNVYNKPSTTRLEDWQVYQLLEILEIHRFVSFGPENIGPFCLKMRGYKDFELNGGGNQYRVISPHEIPLGWTTKLLVEGV